MNARRFTPRIGRRAVLALGAAALALALGLSAIIVAPYSASAAPLHPGKTPSYSADLVTTGQHFGTAADGQVGIGFAVKNEGTSTARPVRLKISFPASVSDVNIIHASDDFNCNVSGSTIWCSLSGVGALAEGGEVGVAFIVSINGAGSATFTGVADPNGAVPESNERNNTANVTARRS